MANQMTNIVLVGRTGNGKSATGNTLLGQNLFTSKKQAGGVTRICKRFRASIPDGPVINVIDTPGLYDLSVSSDNISEEIIRCLKLAEEGIHAVLLVLSVKNRITQEEEATLNALQVIFESKILDYFIVVFTGGDELDEEDMTLDEYLGVDCPEYLKGVLKLCGGRKMLLDNKTRDEDKKATQRNELLGLIDEVAMQNGGKPYTDELHRALKEETAKLKEKEIQIESQNLSPAEQALMKQKSKLEYEEKLKAMSAAVGRILKESAKAQLLQVRQRLIGSAKCNIM